jgi:hypothetical protein
LKKALREHVTSKIINAALDRLLNGGNVSIFKLSFREKKLAIMLVIEWNPHEVLTAGEAAIVYGRDERTLRTRKQNGEKLPRALNVK